MASLTELLDLIKSERASRPRSLEEAVQQATGMQPGMDRLNLLPRYDRQQGWIAPNVLYDLARAALAPGYAAQGGNVTPEEALNFAGNLAGTSVGYHAVAPEQPGRILGIFAGPGAKTADATALERAKALLASGADDASVWRETGWWVNTPDGVPRFEINDSAAVDARAGREYGFGLTGVGAPIDHPALAANYPEMESVRYKMRRLRDGAPGRGGYTPGTQDMPPQIDISSSDSEFKRIGLHELQHGVQDAEGFARGGNPGNAEWADVMPAIEEIRRQKAAMGIDPYAISNKVAAGYHVPADELQRLEQWRRLTEQEDVLMSSRADPYTAYKRLAGEAEARAVEARSEFNDQLRRQVPPWHSYDVPLNELIIRR